MSSTVELVGDIDRTIIRFDRSWRPIAASISEQRKALLQVERAHRESATSSARATLPNQRQGPASGGGNLPEVTLPIALVDAFAERPFTGNPAGVAILTGATLTDAQMQGIALEMNQAETAFTHPLPDGTWSLRWFTPTVEVDLCGHATLATAHRLWETGATDATTIVFATKSGRLTAERTETGIRLDFPAEPPEACDPPPNVAEILGVAPLWWGRNRMDHFAVVRPELLEGDWTARMGAIAALGGRGLIVTAIGGHGRDFVSRCFFPQSGVPEDPVTGSAHCALAPYWGGRLGLTELIGYQASARGGEVRCALRGDRVLLEGPAVTTLTGSVTLS